VSERLDKIISRNTPLPWYRDPFKRGVVIFVAVILIIVLGVFTTLGQPKKPEADTGPGSARPPVERVDGIGIGAPRKH
jgi:hypothetical protein